MAQQPQRVAEEQIATDDDILDQAIKATEQTLDRREAAFIEMQLKTSDRRHRVISKAIDRAIEMATADEQTAASCSYALRRRDADGSQKVIEGPSVRLAEIIMLAWGNLHTEVRVVAIGDDYVTGGATVWDLETNNRVSEEQPRSIMTSPKKGEPRRFSQDMIIITCRAAMSIALRNAIFRIIPGAIVERVRRRCLATVRGDEKSLDTRRADLLRYFGGMGVNEQRVCAAVGKRAAIDIGLDDLVLLRGMATSIKDGLATAEECFPQPISEHATGAGRLAAAIGIDSPGEIITAEEAADLERGCAAAGITTLDLVSQFGPDHLAALKPSQAAKLRGMINERMADHGS